MKFLGGGRWLTACCVCYALCTCVRACTRLCVRACRALAGYAGYHYQKERGAADLSKDELAAILQGADKYPLPDGVFFNGSKYVDWSGQTLKEHPCMPEMIDDFLKEERLGLSSSLARPFALPTALAPALSRAPHPRVY